MRCYPSWNILLMQYVPSVSQEHPSLIKKSSLSGPVHHTPQSLHCVVGPSSSAFRTRTVTMQLLRSACAAAFIHLPLCLFSTDWAHLDIMVCVCSRLLLTCWTRFCRPTFCYLKFCQKHKYQTKIVLCIIASCCKCLLVKGKNINYKFIFS